MLYNHRAVHPLVQDPGAHFLSTSSKNWFHKSLLPWLLSIQCVCDFPVSKISSIPCYSVTTPISFFITAAQPIFLKEFLHLLSVCTSSSLFTLASTSPTPSNCPKHMEILPLPFQRKKKTIPVNSLKNPLSQTWNQLHKIRYINGKTCYSCNSSPTNFSSKLEEQRHMLSTLVQPSWWCPLSQNLFYPAGVLLFWPHAL